MFKNLGWIAGQKPLDDNSNVGTTSHSNNLVPPPSSSFNEPACSTPRAQPPSVRHSTPPTGTERPHEATRPRTTTTNTDTMIDTRSPHDDIVSGVKSRIAAVLDSQPTSSAIRTDASASDETKGKKMLRTQIPMYDPFSGQNIGLLSPGDINDEHDELWMHLSNIHALQSEIAMMHAQMENLGTGERPTRVERSVDDEADNPEETEKVAKDAEFVKLADRFTGRKEQIDRLMSKLNELSKAINDFHATRTPFFQIKNSATVDDHGGPTVRADSETVSANHGLGITSESSRTATNS